MDARIPFVASLSRATTFGDVVEVYKMGGEGTKLTAKLRATYVTDTGNLSPDPGPTSLVFLTKGMMEALAREVEQVWGV